MEKILNTLRRNAIYIKLLFVTFFWGGTFIAGRVLAQSVPPFTSAFLRFLVASAFLLLFALKTYGRLPRLNRQQVLLVLILGLTGIIGYNFFFFSGLKIITASRASMIIASTPVVVVCFSTLIFKEEFTRYGVLGVVLSLTGTLVVISGGNPFVILQGGIGMGELYIIGCVGCWTIFTLTGKVAMRNLVPLVVVTYACIVGTLGLTLLMYLEGGTFQQFRQYSLAVWSSVFFLGFFGTALGFNWYYDGVNRIGPSRSGIFINFVPVFAVIQAVLILHEKVSLSLLVGVVLVMSGVYLTNKRRSPAAPAARAGGRSAQLSRNPSSPQMHTDELR
jgi:drug/metabolite transporter (DMT)-like permease